MKKTNRKHLWLSVAMCAVLIAVTALSAVGCAPKQGADTSTASTIDAASTAATRLGQGETVFTFEAEDKNGGKTVFEIHTDEKTVGEALLKLKLIDGESGPYGLYVKTVDGITLDYNTDGMYWALYVNGEYSMNGVDSIAPVHGTTYTFKPQK